MSDLGPRRPGARRRRRQALRGVEGLKRLLRSAAEAHEEELGCAEAYELLDRFADAVQAGEDARRLMPRVQSHLERCLDCREEYEALLRMLGGTRPAKGAKKKGADPGASGPAS
jgi:hypothetical protein